MKTIHVLLALVASASAFTSSAPQLAFRRATSVPSARTGATTIVKETATTDDTFFRGSDDPLAKLCEEEEKAGRKALEKFAKEEAKAEVWRARAVGSRVARTRLPPPPVLGRLASWRDVDERRARRDGV